MSPVSMSSILNSLENRLERRRNRHMDCLKTSTSLTSSTGCKCKNEKDIDQALDNEMFLSGAATRGKSPGKSKIVQIIHCSHQRS